MKKIILIIVTVIITLSSCDTGDEIGRLFDKIDVIDDLLIGSEVVVQKDTMEIVMTDWWNSTVTLTNNQSYSYKYIETKFVDKSIKFKVDSINDIDEKSTLRDVVVKNSDKTK